MTGIGSLVRGGVFQCIRLHRLGGIAPAGHYVAIEKKI
jgi:hypothetical protein